MNIIHILKAFEPLLPLQAIPLYTTYHREGDVKMLYPVYLWHFHFDVDKS